MDQIIERLLYSYLIKIKQNAPQFSDEQQSQIIELCGRYLMAGFILESNRLDPSNAHLVKCLEGQRRVMAIKNMSMKQDLAKIATNFSLKKIDFLVLKGMALNIGGIYKHGIRASRDIDLLVQKEDIPLAYRTLREQGFQYMNAGTADEAVVFFGKHLPVMTNNRGTHVELHWRVTDVNSHKNCPITNYMFAQLWECREEKRISIPNVESLMAHTLYHGVVGHRMNHGPLFLFDLVALRKHNQNEWPEDTSLMDELHLLDKFNQCKSLIEMAYREKKISQKSLVLINEIMADFDWEERKAPQISLFGVTNARTSLPRIIHKVKHSIPLYAHLWQQPVASFRYWFLYLRHLLTFIRKIRF